MAETTAKAPETTALTLKKPFDLNGEMVERIEYDLEALTGDDIELATAELGKKGIIVTMNETDQRYHAMIFAIAAGIAYEDVKRLPMKDFNRATNIVRDFFLDE